MVTCRTPRWRCAPSRRVKQHQPGELDRSCRRVDRAAEAARHEVRDQAAVVEVRVRQEQRIDLTRIEREREAIADGLVWAALEHPQSTSTRALAGVEEEL